MKFIRPWDFDPGNKRVDINGLTQDTQVIEALRESFEIAVLGGTAAFIEYDNVQSALPAFNVQTALDELVSRVNTLIGAGVYDDRITLLEQAVTPMEAEVEELDSRTTYLEGRTFAGNGVVSVVTAEGPNTVTISLDTATFDPAVRDLVWGVLESTAGIDLARPTEGSIVISADLDELGITALQGRASALEGRATTLEAREQVLLLEATEDETDIPPATPVGTLIFRKA